MSSGALRARETKLQAAHTEAIQDEERKLMLLEESCVLDRWCSDWLKYFHLTGFSLDWSLNLGTFCHLSTFTCRLGQEQARELLKQMEEEVCEASLDIHDMQNVYESGCPNRPEGSWRFLARFLGKLSNDPCTNSFTKTVVQFAGTKECQNAFVTVLESLTRSACCGFGCSGFKMPLSNCYFCLPCSPFHSRLTSTLFLFELSFWR